MLSVSVRADFPSGKQTEAEGLGQQLLGHALRQLADRLAAVLVDLVFFQRLVECWGELVDDR